MTYNAFCMRGRWPLPVTVFLLLAGCSTALEMVPPDPASVAPAAVTRVELENLFRTGPRVQTEAAGLQPVTDISLVRDGRGDRLVRAGKDLTPVYPEIGSFDVSGERKEVAFSARRKDNFDIGLVSIDGSPVNWVPEDPADEVNPRWAPVGNKVAYFVRNRGGDFIRTVHIPTAFQLVTEVPFGRARDLVWDPAGDLYALASESAASAIRVEVMKYDGTQRRLAVAPKVQLDMDTTPFAGGLLLRPKTSTYGEKLPLVVWVSSPLNGWDPHRGGLLGSLRMAGVVTEEATPGLWGEIAGAAWVDPAKIYLVTESAAQTGGTPGHVTIIAGNASLPAGRYRRLGKLISVDPAVVKSFAAGFIAEQLKGTPPRVQQR